MNVLIHTTLPIFDSLQNIWWNLRIFWNQPSCLIGKWHILNVQTFSHPTATVSALTIRNNSRKSNKRLLQRKNKADENERNESSTGNGVCSVCVYCSSLLWLLSLLCNGNAIPSFKVYINNNKMYFKSKSERDNFKKQAKSNENLYVLKNLNPKRKIMENQWIPKMSYSLFVSSMLFIIFLFLLYFCENVEIHYLFVFVCLFEMNKIFRMIFYAETFLPIWRTAKT